MGADKQEAAYVFEGLVAFSFTLFARKDLPLTKRE
jgi:hypothetical protein